MASPLRRTSAASAVSLVSPGSRSRGKSSSPTSLTPDDRADLRRRIAIALNGEDRNRKCHGRSPGGVQVDIQEAAFPGLESADEFAQPSRERRRSLVAATVWPFASMSAMPPVPVRARLAATAAAALLSTKPARVAVAAIRFCRYSPCASATSASSGLAALVASCVSVELERGIVGQSGEFIELAVEPIVDGREPAVGDDAEAHLPGPQLALPLAVDEADDQRGAADRQHQQHGGRDEQRHVGRAYRTAPGRIRWWLCCHFVNPRLIKQFFDKSAV